MPIMYTPIAREMMTSPSDVVFYYNGRVPSTNKWLEPALVVRKIKGIKKYIPILKKTKLYSAVTNEMVYIFKNQFKRTPINYKVDALYYFTAPDNYDTDNFLKCTQDALEKAKVIKNDNLIRNISIIRYYSNDIELFIYLTIADTINPEKPYE